ncbi:citrate transporter [Rhodococcus sp. 05-2256-B2]|uniref:CitMHS family transporter n=1 Tax=unclassified Rhodococcus (in: high G+C Gram-positive bacteria) TaxID=192944 RepID=UPI000B9B4C3E|nr:MULTISPECIES: SLC13 family permease [unclassified Rhodococcus (in: high G+C Gram-positive bacteria)]OZD87789.1 citrate transporter [Rhodococcus sp. 05-2256-B4]OZD89975.1 citrate transporter [Rhodococcus sp. 05-2256-B2]OZD92293.1 citrate transporter [Rhodococcus sp. 05-2256-B3]OZD98998.1 citrate transporter [Rhodococcus sp. 05-2256-B1]
MLSLLGFGTIAIILLLLFTQRVAAIVALAGVPLAAAFLAGNSPSEVAGFVKDGLGGVVGVAAMFLFAIVFFGIMRDAGLFDPLIARIVKWAGSAPPTVAVATTALALVAHLDGAGAVTFLIAVPAMLPIYERLGMSRLVLATCVGLGAGVMNLVPWGGPTARAAATLGVDANELWVPLIPAQIAGVVFALAVAYYLGRRERTRLAKVAAGDVSAEVEESTARVGQRIAVPATGGTDEPASAGSTGDETSEEPDQPNTPDEPSLLRPKLFWVNVVLVVATLGALIAAVAPPETCFIIATIVALLINYPGMKAQSARIEAHAVGAMLMVGTLLAAGVLLGVLDGSGMIESMAVSAANVIPDWMAPALPLIVGVFAVPMSLIFGPDAYYFGVLPVLIEVGDQFGISAIHLAQASIIGEETVGFPISPMTGAFYLLVGLAKVDIGRHIRHTIGWAWLVSLGMLGVAFATGVIPVWVS